MVFFESIERQCSTRTPCKGIKMFHLIVRVDADPVNDPQNDPRLHQHRFMSKRLQIKFLKNYEQKPDHYISATVKKHSCQWISSIWLDADDMLLDGYFKHVTEDIPRVLTETKTSEGNLWRGAVFGLRSSKTLVIGSNRCETLFDNHQIYCCFSQGMGVILSRKVWEELGQKFLHHTRKPNHRHFLKTIREFVMHGLGYADYKSLAEGRWNDTYSAYDSSDAAESRIRLFDLSKNSSTYGVFMWTPFSSHFPWNDINNLSICTEEQINKIQESYPQEIAYMIEAWIAHKEIHPTITETCQNNKYFFKRVNDGFDGNATCNELGEKRLVENKYP